MRYVHVHDDKVPALGLGTWEMEGNACTRAVAHALELGYRHVDTAEMYKNEEAVGQGLLEGGVDRPELFLTTKVWYEHLRPDDTRQAVEGSLRRLSTEYVDLLLIHWPNDDVEPEYTLDVMMKLQDEGKARHLGVSNFTPSLLRRALAHAPVVCNQVEYHPYLAQDELLALAREHALMLTAYCPLARGEVFKDAALREVAEAHGKSVAQVTLRWLIQQDRVAAIPKAATAEHRAANLAIFDFELSEDEMERIAGQARDLRLVDPAWAPAWGT